MIKKPSLIITSLGRTGTKFFSAFFKEIIPDVTSLHEPDIFTTVELRKGGMGIKHLLMQVQESGFMNKVVLKGLGRWSLIQLSDTRVRGKLDDQQIINKVLQQRNKFVNSRPGSVYVESSTAYYGIVDLLKDVYEKHRAAYIIRDGRDWVRSWMNWGQKGGMYTKGWVRSIFSHQWPTAQDVGDPMYGGNWMKMSIFEKLCWAWSYLNRFALAAIPQNPSAKLFLFEDIFLSPNRLQHLEEFIAFMTEHQYTPLKNIKVIDGWLDRQIHTSNKDFPDWNYWTDEHKGQFIKICSPMMEHLGYEL
jgi:hypothetical protein